jgi:hypothetical protein
MAINPAFLGHGIFTEGSVTNVLGRYANYQSPSGGSPQNSVDRFVLALKDMKISTVWIQLFSRRGEFDLSNEQLRQQLIAKLTQANIKWAGWGYCAGINWQRDKGLIGSLKTKLGMSAFVIDAEPGNEVIPNPNDPQHPLPDLWALNDFDQFVGAVCQLFGADNLAISTWPVLKIQNTGTNPVIALMKLAADRVCAFAPQAYWMTFPNHHHYNAGFSQQKYPPDDPASYVRLVIDSWADEGFTNPLVISGQAYWGEGGPLQVPMEAKVQQFVGNFADWRESIGFNWYHGGAHNTATEGSMSDAMIGTIAAAGLNTKPYDRPAPSVLAASVA